MAIALTSLLLMLMGASDASTSEPTGDAFASSAARPQQEQEQEQEQEQDGDAVDGARSAPPRIRARDVAEATGDEATRTLEGLREGAIGSLPKLAIVAALLFAAWLLVRLARVVLRRTLADWPRSTAATAVTGVAIWLATLAVAVTVLAGDVRAFLGSIGLLGLALSWALQTPIESFTGWLLNAFKGYYRVGDRVEVGEVFGDVHRIDVLTTTVWEIGSPFRPSFVHAEQSTGRLITFPNNQILTGSVMNYTRDFPYVWDELSVPVANESDVRYACDVLGGVATELLGTVMETPARDYERILREARLEGAVASAPEVFVSLDDSWTNVTIRYLVDARKRRKYKSDLVLRVIDELGRPEHRGRIIPVVPRRQLQVIGRDGLPREATWFDR